MKKKAFFSVLFFFMFFINCYTQVDLKLIIRSPVPSSLSEWVDDPSVVQLIITNSTGEEYPNATLSIKITNENGLVVAEAKANNPSNPKILVPSNPPVSLYNGSQLINMNAVRINPKLQTIALTTNTIPEGDYEICISLYDQYGKNITLGEEYCTGFPIMIPEPPMLIWPIEDEIIPNSYPTFSWMPVVGHHPSRNQIKYKLKVCPVYEGQLPRTALESNQVLIEKNDLATTSYPYLPSDLPFDFFQRVDRFVWMVQAFDQNGQPASSNQGRSELATFKISNVSSDELMLDAIYPAHNDTIPWTSPHLLVGFSPYSDHIRSVQLNLTIKEEGASTPTTLTRTLSFPNGPMLSQNISDQEKARLLISNLNPDKSFPTWMQNLKQGKKYLWKVQATFTKSDGTSESATSNESAFVTGLKKPKYLFPKPDTSIRINSGIEIGLSIEEPGLLNLLNPDLLDEPLFHGYQAFSSAAINLGIEVSKTSTFDSLVQTQTLKIPGTGTYQAGDECNEVFQKIMKRLDGIGDTGTYFWRLKYLDYNNQTYFSTEPRRLKIVPDSSAGCFEMVVQQPANNGKWTNGKKPRFSVSVKPELQKKAITGGQIKVWKMSSESQTLQSAKSTKALLDTVFSGNSTNKIHAYSTDMNGYTVYDLNFINGDSTSKAFEGDSAAYYVWNFKLNYNKDSIRMDSKVCDSSYVVSNDGVFQLLPGKKDQNSCPGDCYAQTPTKVTPGNQSLKADSTITIGKFKLKLVSVSGTPAFLSGTGSVDVPYMRANVLVEFNGLKVNSDNEVYEGEAYGVIDEDAPYTKPEGNDFEGKALSFAHDKMKFKEIHDRSSSAGRLVSGLIGSTPVTLPLGLDKDWDGYKMVIGIIGMRFTPTQGSLNAAVYVELPSLGPDVGLGFGAKNLCFHEDGLSGMDLAVLYLAQDFGYDNEGTWSFLFKSPTPSDSGTYITWDCKGFHHMVLAADVEFPRTWMTPVNAQDPTSNVKAHFKGRAQKNGNGWQWMASASLDECEFSGAEGFRMQVQEMVFDYSDANNPLGIQFPKNYSGEKNNNWKGFYIKRAYVAFPDKIKTFENESPILSVSNVLIDRTGITGSIRGENVIQYPRGNFGDWGASIDTVNIELVSSSLQSGSLKGKIKVSIADSCFLYSGLLAKNNTVPNSPNKSSLQYQFSIVPKDTIDIDLWKSKLNLYPTSVIELLDTTGKFEGKAVLNGNLSLEGDAGGLSKLDFKGLTFENFKVMTKSPYIEKGNWNFASPQHGMAGFPVSINNIDVVTGSRSGSFGAGIKFNLNIGLQPGANAISGTTTLSVWGKMASGTGAQHFEFDGVDLDSIGVDADLGTVKIKGGLSLFDAHATFGNGFRGAVSATFVDQVAVEATAQFGSVNNFRYWYVDSKALFPTGLPMFSGLGIYGFGGGAWYHMRKSGQTDLSDPPTEADKGTTAGTTNSGYQFTPDKNTEFGLNASMIMGTHPSPEAFNGDVGLETQFLSDGGIGTMTLVGEGYLLCSITNRQKAKILADMNMEYNFPTKTFHGVFDVDINANPLDGGGQMLMHFAPDLWYIKIGEPSNRINVNLADWLEADGYFMAGQNLPPPPPLPATIMELFPDYEANRSSLISTGDGFAFGASSGFDTGRKKYLIFYGDISAIVGFDLALLNLGEGTICTGQTETIGVNGWYAMGQVYAALAASIGLHVDLWFTSGNYEILNLQVGAALQGAGPNPTWVRGSVGGNYRILNGAVKGHCNFQFSMGEPCEVMIESPLARIDLISDINPVSGQNGVDVFTEPQVAMNFQLDTPFEIKEMATNETSGKIRTFRIQLDEFSLRKTSGSDSIQGRKNIGPDKYSACYTPHDMMAGHTRYRFSVAAFGEEYLNGQWQVARKNNGTIIKQNVSSIFKTGPTPKNIPLSNVAFTYPVSSQQYFLQDECRNGRIQLKIGQPELFIPREGFSLELLARFIPIDFNLMPVEVPYSYNPSAKSITFEIPNLLNDKGYYLQIIKKETCTDPNIALMQQLMGQLQEGGLQPSITLFEEKLLERGSSNVFLNRRKISSTKVRSGEKLLHVLYFKTSKFNTLQAKLATFAHTLTETEPGPNSYETHRATYQGAENFGYYDFNPVTSSSYSTQLFGPLIKVNASSRSSEWHTQFTNPQIYDEIAWMKSMGLWSGTVKYEQYLTNQDYHFVDIEYNRHKPGLNEIANLLSGTPTGNSSGTTSTTGTNENFPGNTFAPGGLASTNLSGLLSMGNGSETPNLQLTYNHGKIAASDFNKLTNRALSVLSNPFINKSGVTRNRLQAIVNRNYQMMYRGSYPLWFFYHNVGCYGIDDTVPTISKPFIY